MDITSLLTCLIKKKIVCIVIKIRYHLVTSIKFKNKLYASIELILQNFKPCNSIFSDKTNYYLFLTAATSNSNNYHFIRGI